MFRKKSSGFALIEIMIVVACFSVAAAILVPRYLRKIGKRAPDQQQSTPPASAETLPSD